MLPLPPSVNALYSTNWKTKRRFESKRYEEWKREASIHLLSQPRRPVPGTVSVSYFVGRPDKRRRDVLNIEKAISDFLVHNGIIQDDCLIEAALIAWTDEHPGQVEIIVRSHIAA
jgi:Holliday junction resolvase RusA-like endonuclease